METSSDVLTGILSVQKSRHPTSAKNEKMHAALEAVRVKAEKELAEFFSEST